VAGKSLGSQLGVVAVSIHDERAAHADLSGLAVGYRTIAGVEHLYMNPRHRTPATGETARIVYVVLGFTHGRDDHGALSLAIKLGKHRSDAVDGFLQAGR